MKKYFLILKSTLWYRTFLNHYHFIIIGVALLGITYYFKSFIIGILLIAYLIYLSLKNTKILIFTLIFLGVLFLRLIINDLKFKNLEIGEFWADFMVLECNKGENSYNVLLKDKKGQYLMSSKEPYVLGSILRIKGVKSRIDNLHTPLLYDYQKYCKYQRIFAEVKAEKIEIIEDQFIVGEIRGLLVTYYDHNFQKKSADYLKALVLGNKHDLDKGILTNINNLGISHLFVVSGLHVSILITIIEKGLGKIVRNKKWKLGILYGLLVIYALVTDFLVSVMRVIGCLFLKNINEHQKLHLTALDILSIVTIITLLVNPLFLFSSSFILSFSLTYFLIIGSTILKGNNKIIKMIKMCGYCQIVSLPLVYNFINRINLISVVFNLIFVPFMSYLMLPLSLACTLIPILDLVYLGVIKLFEIMIEISSSLSLYLILPTIPVIVIIGFYWLIYIFFTQIEKKRRCRYTVLIIIVAISLWSCSLSLDPYDEIIFFDLPNGEATYLKGAHNQYNILIDTGDITKPTNNPILQYLKKRGVKTLDYVIITHSDTDHLGGLGIIMSEIKVNNIITNIYEQPSTFQPYLNNSPNTKIQYLQAGNSMQYKKLLFQILSPQEDLYDINNNSLVFLLSIQKFKILFTGDIEKEGEESLFRYSSPITCDILKIAHHGSKTSTTSIFLQNISFQEAIIMNGYYNIFDFPSPVILQKLKGKTVHVTSRTKTIIFRKKWWESF